MTPNLFKFIFVFLASILLLFVIPAKKVMAEQEYMFCAIFSNGSPASTHCEGSMENCERMNRVKESNGDKMCIARPLTSSMSQ